MDAARDLTNTVLDGRYRLTRLMSEGGMGQVYEGVHEQLARKIAVKVLLPRYAFDLKFRERFLREARATSQVRHPNIVQILDFGNTPEGTTYFAMEFLEGRDLSNVLREDGYLPWPRARHLLLQMISALSAAHQHNIIHRDVKPGNFFIIDAGHEEFIKVLDFGIAKIAVGASEDNRTQAQSLTATGEIFGTAKYMAPEQAFGESEDLRVDIYSLGVVAYHMLTGSVPFTGESVFEIITRHVNDPPRAPRQFNPLIPIPVEDLILRAIAKKSRDRFTSMDEMRAALVAIPPDAVGTSSVPQSKPQPPPPKPSQPIPVTNATPLAKAVIHSDKPVKHLRADTDSLQLKAFAPVKLSGTPLDLPVAVNPFKSIEQSPEPEPQAAVNLFKSVSQAETPTQPNGGGGSAEPASADAARTPAAVESSPTAAAAGPDPSTDPHATTPVFSEDEVAALGALRAMSPPRRAATPGVDAVDAILQKQGPASAFAPTEPPTPMQRKTAAPTPQAPLPDALRHTAPGSDTVTRWATTPPRAESPGSFATPSSGHGPGYGPGPGAAPGPGPAPGYAPPSGPGPAPGHAIPTPVGPAGSAPVHPMPVHPMPGHPMPGHPMMVEPDPQRVSGSGPLAVPGSGPRDLPVAPPGMEGSYRGRSSSGVPTPTTGRQAFDDPSAPRSSRGVLIAVLVAALVVAVAVAAAAWFLRLSDPIETSTGSEP